MMLALQIAWLCVVVGGVMAWAVWVWRTTPRRFQ